MRSFRNRCSNCFYEYSDKGRGLDGRRVYRCQNCGKTWSLGMQGRQKKYSKQRLGNQFADSRNWTK